MGKMKVYELAKKMGIKNSEMIEKLNKIGIEVKSHLSTIEEDVANKFLAKSSSKKQDLPNESKQKKEAKQEQVHIIRRNIRVINTNGDKKEVEQITTNITGNIKKSHIVENERKNSNRNSDFSKNKSKNQYDRKSRFANNRNINVVITRNGKPIEKKEEKKVKQEEIKVETKNNIPANEKEMKVEQTKNNIVKESQNNKFNAKNNYNTQQNNKSQRPSNYKNDRYERNDRNDRNDRQNSRTGHNKYNNSNGINTQTTNRSNDSYRNNNYKNNSNNSGYRNSNYKNSDNTSYQVNKFIKQSSNAPVEQKETREYNNYSSDKKKYDKPNVENKKEKLDKNKLREKNSRVSTSKLRGMEINSDGLMELYERDSDNVRKSNKKIKKQKNAMKQTKIIPMTEVKLPEIMTVKEFAEAIKKQASEIVKKLFALGIMATINQDIDFDTAYLIASEFGITAEKEVVVTEEDILFDESEDDEKDLKPRPPIVVVMGHVDHGKTSLLDRLRSANVVSGEAGGITQHIGAYKVKIKDREVCFLDTPGHEAFTAMRARGAQVTDIAIIIVAADDGIKPQTIEAIDHAKAAGVSIVVAINKIDKPTANVEKVKQELLEVGLVPEEWGGDTICVPISAMTGEGIDNLLEMLLLIADMKDLKANPNKQAKGTIIEARLEKTKGTIVSMLVQRGELNVGDTIVVGDMVSRIRAMKDDKGKKVKKAGPSTPVEVLGLSHVPETGDVFYEVENEKVAKQLIEKRKAKARRDLIKQGTKVTLDDLFGKIKDGKMIDLNIIVKADVQGSVEALKESLLKLSNDEVRVKILHASTGGIKESDVTLAAVSNAIIIGFNVRPENIAATQAEKEKVDMRLYNVIYDAIDDVETAIKGLTPKKYKEVMLGTAEIRKIFKITGVGIVAGCYVKSGKILRNQMVRIVRDSIVVLSVKIDNLKREKDEVKEVATGFECGIKLEKFSDIKEGDILECYELVEEKI